MLVIVLISSSVRPSLKYSFSGIVQPGYCVILLEPRTERHCLDAYNAIGPRIEGFLASKYGRADGVFFQAAGVAG
jgi:hypothetical protein